MLLMVTRYVQETPYRTHVVYESSWDDHPVSQVNTNAIYPPFLYPHSEFFNSPREQVQYIDCIDSFFKKDAQNLGYIETYSYHPPNAPQKEHAVLQVLLANRAESSNQIDRTQSRMRAAVARFRASNKRKTNFGCDLSA